MIDIVEILVHWHAGRRIGELCSSLSVDPKTVRKYTAPVVVAGLAPGGPPLTTEQWTALVEEWFPGLVDRARRQTTFQRCAAWRTPGRWARDRSRPDPASLLHPAAGATGS